MAAVWPALLLTLERVFYHELDSIRWQVLGTFRHLLHCHDSFEVAKDFVVVFLSDVPFFGGLCCCKLFLNRGANFFEESHACLDRVVCKGGVIQQRLENRLGDTIGQQASFV